MFSPVFEVLGSKGTAKSTLECSSDCSLTQWMVADKKDVLRYVSVHMSVVIAHPNLCIIAVISSTTESTQTLSPHFNIS